MVLKAELHEVCCGQCIGIFMLDGSRVTVGRDPKAKIISMSGWASRIHAIFQKTGKRWCVLDNHSSTGTYVDGVKIAPMDPTSLKNGTEISLGPSDQTVGRYQFWFSRTYTNPSPPKVKACRGRSRQRSRTKGPLICKGAGCQRRQEEDGDVRERSSRDSSPEEDMMPLRQRLALKIAAEKGVSPYDINFTGYSNKEAIDDRAKDKSGMEKPGTSQSTPKQQKKIKRRRLSCKEAESEESDDENLMVIAITKFQELKEYEEKYHAEVKNRKEMISEIFEDELEKNFQCPICATVFIKATTLGCGHTFCLKCLETWKKQKKTCPICRGDIKIEHTNVVFNDYIQSLVNRSGAKYIEQRQVDIISHKSIGAEVAGVSNNY